MASSLKLRRATGNPRTFPTEPIFEICDPARTFAQCSSALGSHDEGGAALFLDYGYEGSGAVGYAYKPFVAPAPSNPLDEPGSADLTAHVDFQAVSGCRA